MRPGPPRFRYRRGMPMNSINSLSRRRLGAAATVGASCLLVAGCGGSSHSSTTKTSPTVATTPRAALVPPSGHVLAANLVKQMGSTQPMLKDVKPSCSGHHTRYPVTCHFTATQTTSGKQVKIAGTVTVTGASSDGKTYQFALNFAPTH